MASVAAHILPRKRVSAILSEALDNHCLVTLTAPAGYGKSTAALELAATTKRRVFFLDARPSWHNVDYMWSAAFASLAEQGAENAHRLAQAGVPEDETNFYHVLGMCGSFLAQIPTLLIFDDYQFTAPNFTDGFMESLVREEIPGFSILLLGRESPGFALEYLRMKGYAAVFGPELLAFTREESRQLFASSGIAEPEVADAAQDFSEGWVTALRMSLQSYMAGGTIEPVTNMDKIFTEIFFSTYEEPLQKILLQLSVLGTFTSAQAVMLCDDPSVPQILRDLYKRNAFLGFCPERDTYTIHGLFRAYLANRLAENTLPVCRQINLPLLHRRAAECCLEEKDYLQAIRFFAEAGTDDDFLRILQIFERPGEGFFIVVDPGGIAAIMESIPCRIRRQCPIGYLGFIQRFMVRVDRDRGSAMLLGAERYCRDEAAFSPDLHKKILGEIELIHAVGEFNDIEAMCRHYKEAFRLLEGGRSSLVNRNMFWTFYCPHSALLYLREAGAYKDLLKVTREGLPFFEEVSGGANAGASELLKAEYLLETGSTSNVLQSLLKAEYKAKEKEQFNCLLAISFTRARMYLAEGNIAQAGKVLEEVAPVLESTGNLLLMHALRLCRGYIAAVCNQADDLPAWSSFEGTSPPHKYFQNSAFKLVVQGKALMTYKDWPRLEVFADEAGRQMAAIGSVFGRVHALLFKAIALMHTSVNSTPQAERYFFQARELAEPDGIVTSLAEYGPHLYPLLQRLLNLHPEDGRLTILSRKTKKYARLNAGRAQRLTLREQDILEKASTGATNRDIGRELGITSGSVANTLSRIYMKLDAGSRLEAIQKWSRNHEPPSASNDE